MKKLYKILNILLILVIFLGLMPAKNYAVEPISSDSIKQSADKFISEGQKESPLDIEQVKELIKPIAGILTLIGEGILVILTIIQGIKYTTATPDEQAKIKKQLIGLVVAAIVIFAAYEIWKLVNDTMQGIVG